MKYPSYLFTTAWLCLTFISCDEKVTETKPIVLGDSSMIVTEKENQYLVNVTQDISPTKKKSAEGEITEMMTQIDSAKSVKKLEDKNTSIPLRGFTIHFTECDVVFDGLSAHALNTSQDERNLNSVSYVRDAGNMNEMSLRVSGLENVKVEQRTFTRLLVDNGTEAFVLHDLGKFISPWSTLAGKNTTYISLGSNSLQFFATDASKIKNALDRELRKKKKNREAIQQWMSLISKTKSYTDAPCKLTLVSSQWRIIGTKNGKRVQKLIQFDIP
ncbi:MAG: hypothetical protein IPI46_09690 [Bacteroidetes bacterium]|nr:hypothetical protein [Bacteroidota bacterium]